MMPDGNAFVLMSLDNGSEDDHTLLSKI